MNKQTKNKNNEKSLQHWRRKSSRSNKYYMGITFKSDNVQGMDYREVAARIFISPRIPCEKVMTVVDYLERGRMSIDDFLVRTNIQIQQLRDKDEYMADKMVEKIEKWIDEFGFSADEIDFITEHFGFTYDDLLASSSSEITWTGDPVDYFQQYINDEDDTWCVSETCDSEVKWEQGDKQSGSISDGQKDALKTIVTAFKDMPSYDYYYRFIIPVEYEHPDFEGCDKETWDVLYQLLFGSFRTDCHLKEYFDGTLELCFCDAEGFDRAVSDLSVYELDVLIFNLWIALGVDVLPVTEPEQLNLDIEIECKGCDLITKEEFYSLYKIEKNGKNDNLSEMLENMYDKIVKSDSESFVYRC